MKTFVLRLVVTLVTLYALGAIAYGLLHYPAGERPSVGGILGDYTRDLGSIFRRSGTEAASAPSGPKTPSGREILAPYGDVRGDLELSLDLSRVYVPDSSHLTAAAAQRWDAVRPIHEKVLPDGIGGLGRLRMLATTDKAAFERERGALREGLAAARRTLLPLAHEQPPFEAAVVMLDVLDRLDARVAGL